MSQNWKGYYKQFATEYPMTFTEFNEPTMPGGQYLIKGSDENGQVSA